MHDDKMIEVLAHVEDERERFERKEKGALGFNMDVWHSKVGESEGSNLCGTTACLAGHAAVQDGWLLINSTDCGKPSPTNRSRWEAINSIEQAGAEALGLNEVQSDDLFYCSNLDEVYQTLADWMNVDETVLRDKVQASRRKMDW